jgi:hypothetical protein
MACCARSRACAAFRAAAAAGCLASPLLYMYWAVMRAPLPSLGNGERPALPPPLARPQAKNKQQSKAKQSKAKQSEAKQSKAKHAECCAGGCCRFLPPTWGPHAAAARRRGGSFGSERKSPIPNPPGRRPRARRSQGVALTFLGRGGGCCAHAHGDRPPCSAPNKPRSLFWGTCRAPRRAPRAAPPFPFSLERRGEEATFLEPPRPPLPTPAAAPVPPIPPTRAVPWRWEGVGAFFGCCARGTAARACC